MEIEYTKQGDYLIPNLIAPIGIANYNIGKFGKLRLKYLKENKRALYIILLMENTLQKHLIEVDTEANNCYEILIKQFAEKENINEELKSIDQIKWVRINE